MQNIKTVAARLAVLYQVSTYKVVTINTSRPTPDFSSRRGSLQQRIKSVPTLMYHADTSATPEPAVIDEAMHTANAKVEMQTWMLLEVSVSLCKVEVLLLHASPQE